MFWYSGPQDVFVEQMLVFDAGLLVSSPALDGVNSCGFFHAQILGVRQLHAKHRRPWGQRREWKHPTVGRGSPGGAA